jgi:hypothetical protein
MMLPDNVVGSVIIVIIAMGYWSPQLIVPASSTVREAQVLIGVVSLGDKSFGRHQVGRTRASQ